MLCHVCAQETNAAVKFCEFCGAELERNFDLLADELVRETEEEKIQKIEEEIQKYLAFVLFIFAISLTFYLVIPEIPKVDLAPSYQHSSKKKEKKSLQIPFLKAPIPE